MEKIPQDDDKRRWSGPGVANQVPVFWSLDFKCNLYIPERKSCVSLRVSVLSPEEWNVCLITVNNSGGKILRFANFQPSATCIDLFLFGSSSTTNVLSNC